MQEPHDLPTALSNLDQAISSLRHRGPGLVERQRIEAHVRVVRTNVVTGKVDVFETTNVITNDGDDYYAQLMAGETPTNTFNRLVLADAVNAPGVAKAATYDVLNNGTTDNTISGSTKAFDATYPKTNDDDTDNANAATNAVSYRVSYGTGEANAADITHAAIVTASPTPGSGSPILNVVAFAAGFTKTSQDTLKVIITHTQTGV